MILRSGIEFNEANPREVWDHLNNLNRETIVLPPGELHFSEDDKDIYLDLFNDGIKQYPIRQVCLDKLLKWFRIPNGVVHNLSLETTASILNDLLFSIRSKNVLVKIEDGEVLTLASDKFTDFPDLTLLNSLNPADISSISRNDYMMTIKGQIQFKIDPFPGDEFGVGISVMNSETGFRSFEIVNYLLRFTCSNGCYVKRPNNHEKIVHYKRKPQEMINAVKEAGEFLRNDLQRISKEIALLDCVVEEEDLENIAGDLRRIVGARSYKIYPIDFYGDTKYSVFNSITDWAKSFDMQARQRIEEYAGNMISLN